MTTPVPTPKFLKEYLEDLNDERLKEFHWQLWQLQIDGSRPIPKSKLPENSTREATVDKLVEAFGEDGAVERTVETLREIKHNDLASKLKQAKENQSMKQKEEEPETSSAREKPREINPTLSKSLRFFFADHTGRQRGHSQSYVYKDWKRNIVGECSPSEQLIHEFDPLIRYDYLNDTEPFQTPPENIGEKQEAFKKVDQWHDSSIEDILTQYFNTDMQITDQYNRRRALLDEEEKTIRAALRQQTRQKICMTNWIADRTKHTLDIKANRRFLVNKRFTETLQVCTVFIISVLLVVGIGWTLTIFATPAPCVEARGKPSARSLGDVEQHKTEQK